MNETREPPTPSPLLPYKLGFFLAGAVLGIAGMATKKDIVVSLGIAFLAFGIVVRIIESRRARE